MDNYGKWPEAQWISDDDKLKKAKRYVCGIDIGTVSTQVVLLADGELFSYANIYTGLDFKAAYQRALKMVLEKTGLQKEDIMVYGATGFGKGHASETAKKYDEIQCHGVGARYMYGPEVETVFDLGGQTSKAIRMYKWNRVRDFMVNDKCATGMGKNIEDLCNLLQVNIEDIGKLSLEVEKEPEPVSTTCFAFAQTETAGLFHPGYKEPPVTENEVYASYLFAIAWRILGLTGRIRPLDVGELDTYGNYAFTGGLAKNIGITARIEKELPKKALQSPYDPMLAGAIGAALLADL